MKDSTSTSTTPRIGPDIITDEFLKIMRTHGVVEAYLFGSVSRGEEQPDSDINLLVSFAPSDTFGEQFLLAEEPSRLSGRRVDVATNLHPAFAPYITPTLVSRSCFEEDALIRSIIIRMTALGFVDDLLTSAAL